MITEGAVFDAIQTINWSYGRGDLIGFDPARKTATRRIPVSQSAGFWETRRYTVNGNRVRFLGHTRKLGQVSCSI